MRIEAGSICHQQFANVFADCFCAVHTHQLEFANFSLPCQGRFSLPKPNYSFWVMPRSWINIASGLLNEDMANMAKYIC